MTTVDVKNLLISYKELEAKLKIWEECFDFSSNCHIEKEYQKLFLQLDIMNQGLTLLKEQHKFVIETHLIQHYIWKETSIKFQKEWGLSCSRSERTLKRMQAEGIQEILNFIKTANLESYFQKI